MTLHWLERILFTCFFFISATCLVSLEIIIATSAFISVPPDNVIGAYGSTVIFNWQISGTVIERKWKFRRSLVIAKVNRWNDTGEDSNIGSRYKGRVSFPYGSPELTLTNLTFSDAGQYTCDVLTDKGDKFFSSVKLLIYVYPTFGTSLPATVKSSQYKNVGLKCSVSSKPASSISWSHGGNEITIKEAHQVDVTSYEIGNITHVSSTLTLKNVTTSDQGEYHCIASHYFGKFNQSTTLEVHSFPVITSFPEDDIHTSESSASVSINCQATGFPLPTISWYKDNVIISLSGTHYDMKSVQQKYSASGKGFVNSTLTVKNIEKSDLGVYTCEALNVMYETGKQSVKDSVYVLVNYQPHIINPPLPTYNVDNGTRITLNCTVHAFPQPEVSWSSTVATSSNRFSFQTSTLSSSKGIIVVEALLSIENVMLVDYGVYTCMSSSANVSNSWSTTLFVQYRPILLANSTEQNISASLTGFELSCEAKGYPPVTKYKWSKDGVPFVYNEPVYRIEKPNFQSQGTYECTPGNSIGVGRTVTHVITVLIKPVVTGPATCVPNHGMLYCSCSGVGNPPLQIYWTKSPSEEILSDANTLNISVNSNVSGTYNCHMENENGVILTSHLVTTLLSYWSTWAACNVSCGDGFTSRYRSCTIPPCLGILREKKTCFNSSGCVPVIQQSGRQVFWHKDWYIVFWVLIPLIVILILFFLIWASRKQSPSSKKAVFVSSFRDTAEVPPTIRSIQTRPDSRPDIRLPPYRVNGGFVHDGRTRMDNKEVMEVVMYLSEDDSSHSPPPLALYTDIKEVVENHTHAQPRENLPNCGPDVDHSNDRLYDEVACIVDNYDGRYVIESRRPVDDPSGSQFDDSSTVCL